MQTVDILRDEGEFRKRLLPARNFVVGYIRHQTVHEVAAIIKPFPDRREISFKHFCGGYDVERNSLPARGITAATKRRHARFSGNPGACKHKDTLRFGKALPEFR